MEKVIEPHVGFCVARADAGINLQIDALQCPGINFADMTDRHLRELRFQQEPCFQKLIEPCWCHFRNLNAAVRLDIESAFGSQSLNYLAHRHWAHAKFLGKSAQRHRLAGYEASGDQGRTDGLVDLRARGSTTWSF